MYKKFVKDIPTYVVLCLGHVSKKKCLIYDHTYSLSNFDMENLEKYARNDSDDLLSTLTKQQCNLQILKKTCLL